MKFTVVRSSAGSGKTYTLVKKYLLFILGKSSPNYYRHILAITFTNKATNEMKNRIVEALEGLTYNQPKYHGLLSDVALELSLKEEVVVHRANAALKQLVHNYADFSISTIDRFVTRIIKSFSFELSIPAGFEIELDQQRIMEKSIDALLDKVATDKALEKLLVAFADFKFSSNKSFQLERDLLEMANEVNNTESTHFVQELQKDKAFDYNQLRKKIFLSIKQIESHVRQKARDLLVKVDECGAEQEDLVGGKRGIYAYLTKLIDDQNDLKQMSAVGYKIIDSANWKSAKAKAEVAVILDKHSEDLTRQLKELSQLIEANWSFYNFCKIMAMRVDLMSIIYEMAAEIDAFKEANNILQLEDFNQRISSLINDSPVPYIYERTGEKFNHYLIDEFQDTSQIQWYNLIPLLEESLSQGNESLIVGDEKQAIYRFRGGDVNQMGRLPSLYFDAHLDTHYKYRELTLIGAFESQNLAFNYRSSQRVVEFVNDFFLLIREQFPSLAGTLYKDHEQSVIKKDVEGSVCIKFMDPNLAEEERLLAIKDEIDKYISIGYSLGDIAILCRKTRQCSAVASYFMEQKYAVFSSESLKLSSSQEVQFLINWLRMPVAIDKVELEFAILHYLVQNKLIDGFDNDAFLKDWTNESGFNAILKTHCAGFDIESLFAKSLVEILTELTYHFLKGSHLNPFILGLVDQVIRFQEQFGNDRLAFIKWWDEKGYKIDVEMPSQNDSIQVMTVHKAKGLEFNVVLLPFMNESISAGKKSLWVATKGEEQSLLPIAWLPMNKSLMETNYAEDFEDEMNKSFIDTLNVMYVAITRAAHHLSIFSSDQKKKDNKWREDNLLWNCFSLQGYQGSEESAEMFKGNLKKYESGKTLVLDNIFEIQSVSKFDWRKEVELKFRSDDVSLSDTDLSAKEYGNLFHDILSKISFKKDVPFVINGFVQKSAIDKKEADKMLETIEETLDHKLIKAFYENHTYQVYNEREIMSDSQELLRPDRIMIKDNTLILIDYKTGKADQSHVGQIQTYIKALKQIGDYSISAFLVYFFDREVRKVA